MNYMSREDVLKQLAFITGKVEASDVKSEGESSSQDINNNQEETVDDASEIGSDNSEPVTENATGSTASSLEDLQKVFGGNIVNKYLMDARQMTRKEYNQYSKGLTQSELLDHPLLYIMFRAENQAQVNFLEWVSRFKK
jgi:hypothetical protein